RRILSLWGKGSGLRLYILRNFRAGEQFCSDYITACLLTLGHRIPGGQARKNGRFGRAFRAEGTQDYVDAMNKESSDVYEKAQCISALYGVCSQADGCKPSASGSWSRRQFR